MLLHRVSAKKMHTTMVVCGGEFFAMVTGVFLFLEKEKRFVEGLLRGLSSFKFTKFEGLWFAGSSLAWPVLAGCRLQVAGCRLLLISF